MVSCAHAMFFEDQTYVEYSYETEIGCINKLVCFAMMLRSYVFYREGSLRDLGVEDAV